MEDFNSKYSGEQVEALLDQVASGNAGGGAGGGITVEKDPVFSASPAASITEEQIVAWDDLAEMVDLLDADVAQLTGDVMGVQESLEDLDTIRSGAAKGATAVQASSLATVATSGSYTDLSDKPTIPSAVTESTVSGWGFTKNTGTYSKPSTGIPKSDLSNDVQTSLTNADNAAKTVVTAFDLIDLERGEDITETYKEFLIDAVQQGEVVLVPYDKDNPSTGNLIAQAYVEDLLYITINTGIRAYMVETAPHDEMIYAHEITYCDVAQKESVGDLSTIEADGVYDGDYVYALPTAAEKNANEDYDDILLSRGSVKTINGQSIYGSGDITISGGSGEQGPQGDKGDKGDDGVGVASVVQTTTSNADGGTNVVTVTLSNGTTSTFNVKNGSKGSNGTNGKDGANGATFTPSVDSNGNLSWTNDKGLANPPTVNIKGPKGDSGSGGSGGGPNIDIETSEEIMVMDNTVYDRSGVSSLTVYPGEQLYIGSIIRFWADSDGCELTIADCKWANGIVPEIQPSSWHELSLTGNEDGELMAVLTHFR